MTDSFDSYRTLTQTLTLTMTQTLTLTLLSLTLTLLILTLIYLFWFCLQEEAAHQAQEDEVSVAWVVATLLCLSAHQSSTWHCCRCIIR